METKRLTPPHTIVLIEDDPSVTRLLTIHLERAGCSVRTAGSLEEARHVLRGNTWDLVLLDRRLPDGDGLELCSEIRRTRPDAYIMILTGRAGDPDKILGFEAGADDYVTKPFNVDELLARVRAGLRIVDLQKALFASNQLLHDMSLTDALTGLRNRRALDQELATRFATAGRYHRALSVAVVDVDHFKQINDSFGHQMGDIVLREVASLLRRGTRATDVVARLGGEEFCLLLPETGLFEAAQVGEKIRALIASSVADFPGVTVSVGIASMPHSHVQSAEELMFAADAALYRAKNNGRNRVECEKRTDRHARRPASGRAAGQSIQAQA